MRGVFYHQESLVPRRKLDHQSRSFVKPRSHRSSGDNASEKTMRRRTGEPQIAGTKPLSHAQLARLQRWFDEKGILPACELCEHEDELWHLNSRVYSLIGVAGIESGRMAHRPLLTLHCGNCGHVRMFDPYVIFEDWRWMQ